MAESVKAEADVMVTGAGPGGLMAAYVMARAGLAVTVVEKKTRERIGRPVRVSMEKSAFSLARLDPDGAPLLGKVSMAREIFSPYSKIKIQIAGAPLVRFDHREFVQWLAHKAEAAGARLLFETTVTGPVVENGRVAGVVGSTADGRLFETRARLSIDASGIIGVLRHHLPSELGVEREILPLDVANIWQESREINREMVMELVHKGRLRPQVNVIRLGFMGPYSSFSVYVDLEDDRVEITAGLSHDPHYPTAKDLVAGYIESHPWVKERISEGGGLAPARRPLDSFVADGFACVGDAACQTVPLHAGGLASSLDAGRVLGEVAAEVLAGGDASRAALWPYNARFMESRGGALANSDLYRRFILTLSTGEVATLFASGLVTGEGIQGSMEGLALELPKSAIVGAGVKTLSRPGLLYKLFRLSRDAVRVLDAYDAYPAADDPVEFSRWRESADRIFGRWRPRPAEAESGG